MKKFLLGFIRDEQGQDLVDGANLNRANLEGANLPGGRSRGARLTHAQLDSAKLGGANLVGAQLAHADLSDTDLSTAKLDEADLTSANLTDANLEEASLVGAQLRDAQLDGVNSRTPTSPTPTRRASQPAGGPGRLKRYFGKGDVLRNAHLEFDAGASVEIESLFEQCTIALGDGDGARGRQGRRALRVPDQGRGQDHDPRQVRRAREPRHRRRHAAHRQRRAGRSSARWSSRAEQTRFAFEPGCMLRMKIQQGKKDRAVSKGGRPR